MAQLCEYMQSLKVKEVSSAAEAKMAELEARLGGPSPQIEQRLAALEAGLAQEQQSSLKALQAILANSAGTEP